jgi:hypothetical protein
MDEGKKGFVIKDRRMFDEGGQARPQEDASVPENKTEEVEENSHRYEGEEKLEDQTSFEMNFSNFLISLSTSVLFNFGDFPDPTTQKAEKNLPAAKQIIDTISMLKNKTEGNLDEDEKALLDGVLYELRMRYVKEKTA